MIPKRKHKPHEENVDAWLMTYADMITLLLCFFVIFVSVSEPKRDKISQIAEGMVGKFGAVNYETPFMGAVRALQTSVETHKLYKDVAIESRSSDLNVELATHRFFRDGGADIDDSMAMVLNELLDDLKQTDISKYTLAIESHTDDMPPKSGLYKTNWELSSARAAKLANYFIKKGFPPDHIKAVGYADSRPKVPNMDQKGKPIPENRARNQRVSIRLTLVE